MGAAGGEPFMALRNLRESSPRFLPDASSSPVYVLLRGGACCFYISRGKVLGGAVINELKF
ncbi:MAG: hypothetical protein LBU37_13185 [Tannerellaceae bacterium]|nr:hypothetical protein [Tannerellaceae bacterium]